MTHLLIGWLLMSSGTVALGLGCAWLVSRADARSAHEEQMDSVRMIVLRADLEIDRIEQEALRELLDLTESDRQAPAAPQASSSAVSS